MPSIPPAGLSPASAFELVGHATAEPPPAILADKINAQTGEYESLTEGASIADGLVVQLLRTERSSGASVLNFGQRFRELRNVTKESPEVIESMAREALQPGRDAGVVAFRQVEAQIDSRDRTQINGAIAYDDLLAPRRKARGTFPLKE